MSTFSEKIMIKKFNRKRKPVFSDSDSSDEHRKWSDNQGDQDSKKSFEDLNTINEKDEFGTRSHDSVV